VCVSRSEQLQDENGYPEAKTDEDDQDRSEGSKRDHRNTSRQHSPGKRSERSLWPEGPRGRLKSKKPADSSVKARPKLSALGGLDTSMPTANHFVRLSPLREAEEGQPAPTPAPKLKRTAGLIKRRRGQHLLEQQLVRVTIDDEPHAERMPSVADRLNPRRSLPAILRLRIRSEDR
jgi:hypothetical protein